MHDSVVPSIATATTAATTSIIMKPPPPNKPLIDWMIMSPMGELEAAAAPNVYFELIHACMP